MIIIKLSYDLILDKVYYIFFNKSILGVNLLNTYCDKDYFIKYVDMLYNQIDEKNLSEDSDSKQCIKK